MEQRWWFLGKGTQEPKEQGIRDQSKLQGPDLLGSQRSTDDDSLVKEPKPKENNKGSENKASYKGQIFYGPHGAKMMIPG